MTQPGERGYDYALKMAAQGERLAYQEDARREYVEAIIEHDTEATLHYHCHACGAYEAVRTLRHGAYVGSAADFCSTCDTARKDTDLVKITGPVPEPGVCLCGAPMQFGRCSVEGCVCQPEPIAMRPAAEIAAKLAALRAEQDELDEQLQTPSTLGKSNQWLRSIYRDNLMRIEMLSWVLSH